MARYLLVALNRPTQGEGDEAEYNKWYNEVHLPDLQKITGNISTRRFNIIKRNRTDMPYMAVTEFEAENADDLMQELADKASDFTDKIDRTTSIFVLGLELDTNSKSA